MFPGKIKRFLKVSHNIFIIICIYKYSGIIIFKVTIAVSFFCLFIENSLIFIVLTVVLFNLLLGFHFTSRIAVPFLKKNSPDIIRLFFSDTVEFIESGCSFKICGHIDKEICMPAVI